MENKDRYGYRKYSLYIPYLVQSLQEWYEMLVERDRSGTRFVVVRDCSGTRL